MIADRAMGRSEFRTQEPLSPGRVFGATKPSLTADRFGSSPATGNHDRRDGEA